MTAQKPRNRIVVFRLSQDEFSSLKSACAEKGGRNLSDFTRSELLSFLQAPPLAAALEQRLFEIERQMVELLAGMRQISHLLDGGLHLTHNQECGAGVPSGSDQRIEFAARRIVR